MRNNQGVAMLRVCFMHEFEYRNTGCKYQTQTQVRNSTSNWGIQDPLTCNTNTCVRWLCVCVYMCTIPPSPFRNIRPNKFVAMIVKVTIYDWTGSFLCLSCEPNIPKIRLYFLTLVLQRLVKDRDLQF